MMPGSVTHSFHGGLSDRLITTFSLPPFKMALIAEPVEVLNWIAPEINPGVAMPPPT